MSAEIGKPAVTTPSAVPCDNSMCSGKSDGNYEYYYHGKHYNSHYFLQCSEGKAYCQACWPLNLVFSKDCNQCLYNQNDECYTTKTWTSAPTYHCPDMCAKYGPNYSGNMYDHYNLHHYVACWKGITVGCINCPKGLLYNEKHDACLYEGHYYTEPEHDDDYV